MTLNLIPLPELQFFDNNGLPLNGGKVYTYDADGLTPKPTYQDPDGDALNPNPILLDSSGRALIYGSGQYVWGVFDALGNEIYIQPTADPVAEIGVSAAMLPVVQAATTAQALVLLGAAPAGSSLPIGLGPLPWPTASAPTGWLFCAGQNVSRATYSALFGVIGTIFGTGDGSTTFGLPDMRGRVPAGTDALGGTPANRLTSASLGASATLGAAGGDELAQDPGLNTSVTDPMHAHQEQVGQPLSSGIVAAWNVGTGPNLSPLAVNTGAASTGITVSVTSTSTGASQNVQPTLVVNYIIFAGA